MAFLALCCLLWSKNLNSLVCISSRSSCHSLVVEQHHVPEPNSSSCSIAQLSRHSSVVTECGQMVTLVTKYTYMVRASRAVRTSPQVLTLKARLLQASRAVHRRLRSAVYSQSQPAWACRTDRLVRTEELASNTDPGS